MFLKKSDPIQLKDSAVKLGFICAVGIGIIALCSKVSIQINNNVTIAGRDLYQGEVKKGRE